ncbi:hypothetical protein SPONN_2552 [uncultured Candidatus Thioglobus sp.]|nr:hypothetical protein SPONN_2552 [uncultured Candidatus Thioglobus sp.]
MLYLPRPDDFDYNPKQFIEPVTAQSLHKKMVNPASSPASMSNPHESTNVPVSTNDAPSQSNHIEAASCSSLPLLPNSKPVISKPPAQFNKSNPPPQPKGNIPVIPESNPSHQLKNKPYPQLNNTNPIPRANPPQMNESNPRPPFNSKPPQQPKKSNPRLPLNSKPTPQIKKSNPRPPLVQSSVHVNPKSSPPSSTKKALFKVCQYCGRKYSHSSSLSKHMKVHKEITAKSRSISCAICNER